MTVKVDAEDALGAASDELVDPDAVEGDATVVRAAPATGRSGIVAGPADDAADCATCRAEERAMGRCGSSASRWTAGGVAPRPVAAARGWALAGPVTLATAAGSCPETGLVDSARWTPGRGPETASGIGLVAVVRLTTGCGVGVPTGRAEAGSDVMGSPRPRRVGTAGDAPAGDAWEGDESVGIGAGAIAWLEGIAAGDGGAVGSACAEVAWRLTTGIAGEVPDGTRRMPREDWAGAASAVSAAAAAAARCTAAGMAAIAAEVRGRSGTRTDWRETVGIVRIGVATGVEIGSATSGVGAGIAIACAGSLREVRSVLRCTGAGRAPLEAAWMGRTRAITRPGMARALTS